MSYGDETPLQSDAFEAEVLGGDPYMDAANSQLLGLGYVAPEVAPNGQASGAVQLDASSGHATWRRRLSPNQRAAVRRFFTAPEAPSTATPSDK
ncbi:MAG: hypothetical protein ACI9D0_000866 [Bacteroidia bacterium]|jgi:hypothetical protein